MKGPEPAEWDIQRAVLKALAIEIGPPGHLSKHGVTFFAIDHAHYAGIPSLRVGRGIIAGIPDIFMLWRGLSFFIELKREAGGEISQPQQWLLPVLAAAGSRIGVARSVAEVLALIDAWGIPRRGLIKEAA